jgi:hypothetical protein
VYVQSRDVGLQDKSQVPSEPPIHRVTSPYSLRHIDMQISALRMVNAVCKSRIRLRNIPNVRDLLGMVESGRERELWSSLGSKLGISGELVSKVPVCSPVALWVCTGAGVWRIGV